MEEMRFIILTLRGTTQTQLVVHIKENKIVAMHIVNILKEAILFEEGFDSLHKKVIDSASIYKKDLRWMVDQ